MDVLKKIGWRGPTFILWNIFFALGLFPENFYFMARQCGNVMSQHAWVNSYHLVTIAFTFYCAQFAFHRAMEMKCAQGMAYHYAARTAIVAFVAFLAVPLYETIHFYEIPDQETRRVLLFIAALKLLAWGYLYVQMCLCYFGRNRVESCAAQHSSPVEKISE